MVGNTKHICMKFIIGAVIFSLTGCSVFVSTPRIASFQIQKPDNKLVSHFVYLDEPEETNLDIDLNNRYTIQLDFEWLWDDTESPQIYYQGNRDDSESGLAPWMICKYRF